MKTLIVLFSAMIVVSACSKAPAGQGNLQAKVDSLEKELTMYREENAKTQLYLARFDSLDFDIYSNQKWDLLNVSHDNNILVTYPDGHQTKDIETHITELKPMFVFAPDTKISEHPIKFGSGDWTCVTGYITGTFSKPMPIGNGKTIPPTGKSFKLSMCTIGHWKDGKMIEESLFWDNQYLLKQIGVGN